MPVDLGLGDQLQIVLVKQTIVICRVGANTGGVRHKDYHSGTLEVIRVVNCSKNCSTDRKNLAVNRFFF